MNALAKDAPSIHGGRAVLTRSDAANLLMSFNPLGEIAGLNVMSTGGGLTDGGLSRP